MRGDARNHWWIFNVIVIKARGSTSLERLSCFSWFYQWTVPVEIASALITVSDIRCVHSLISTLFTNHQPFSITALLS